MLLAHYGIDHANNWHFLQNGSLPNLFQFILRNLPSGTHNIKANEISHQLTLIAPQGKSESLVTLGIGIASANLGNA